MQQLLFTPSGTDPATKIRLDMVYLPETGGRRRTATSKGFNIKVVNILDSRITIQPETLWVSAVHTSRVFLWKDQRD